MTPTVSRAIPSTLQLETRRTGPPPPFQHVGCMYRISCPVSQAPGSDPLRVSVTPWVYAPEALAFTKVVSRPGRIVAVPCEPLRRPFHPHRLLLIFERGKKNSKCALTISYQSWKHTPAARFPPLCEAPTAWLVPAAGLHDTLSHQPPNLNGQGRAGLAVGSATKIQNCCFQPRMP